MNRNDGAAIESGLGYFVLVAKHACGVQLAGSKQAATDGAERGQKRTAIPGKLQIHGDVLRFFRNYFSADAGGLTTCAVPTISISESPGIHSTAMQARDGDLPGEK